MAIRVAINGFGRIGRSFVRASLNNPDVEVVAVNDLTSPATLAHLLQYDSTQGVLGVPVTVVDGDIKVGKDTIKVLAERSPAALPWAELKIDVVIESTGLFTSREAAAQHLTAGAKKVLISAPSGDADATLVMGVNEDTYDAATQHVISNASCTTNCLAPVVKVLNDAIGVDHGFMTTIHSYTGDQPTLDTLHKDLYRGRAAALSMIPTTTGAAKAVGLVLPELKGKLDGVAIRVPTPNVSVVDLVFETKRATTVAEVNEAIKAAADGHLKGILGYTLAPNVSACSENCCHSAPSGLPAHLYARKYTRPMP